MATIYERVSRGIAFLDHRVPNWRSRIDIAKFEIRSDTGCILGQLFEYYIWACRELELEYPDRVEMGFTGGGAEELNAEWRRRFAIFDRVARGVALLDSRSPGWREDVNIESLRMSDCIDCVLGQLGEAGYLEGARRIFDGADAIKGSDAQIAAGFWPTDDGEDDYEFENLAQEWKRRIIHV